MLEVVSSNDSPKAKEPPTRLWDDSNTGDWRSDNRSGREKADLLINALRGGKSTSYLGHVVKQMAQNAAFGGVEVGFFHRIAEVLAAA